MTAHLIRAPEDLEAVAKSRNLLFPGLSFRLEVPDLTEAERARWERRINRYSSVCGCKSSAWFLTIAVIGYLGFLLLAPDTMVPQGWSRLSWGVGVVFIAGLIGKLIGLLAGSILLRRTLRSLRLRLASEGNR